MFYLVRSSWLIKKIYKQCTWSIQTNEKKIFLTFDDGPHPTATPFVLNELKQYNAKATFFCIGKNVSAHPEIYRQIIDDGHAVGNHTHNHLNGWKSNDQVYLDDIATAKKYIDSNLYRPPYGRITGFQLRQLAQPRFNLKTIMWTILSGDFDTKISKEKCLENVLLNAGPGSIIVFHDSEKAFEKMKFALAGTLNFFAGLGYRFEKISADIV